MAGVRAASFPIIAGIGVYMLYRAVRMPTSAAGGGGAAHGHGHEHSHGSFEGGILALAAGMVPCPGAVPIMLYAVANDMIHPGFPLVGAMSLGIGPCICVLGVGAILARQTALRVMEGSGGSRGVATLRNTMNHAGAAFATLVGLVSFIAFLDVPPG